jgi:hypothetical protein
MNGWEKMFEDWHKTYYVDPFMFICEWTAVVLGLFYQRKSKVGQLFITYALIDVSMLTILDYLDYFSTITNKKWQLSLSIINSISFLLELLAYFFFFQKALSNEKIKKILSVFGFIFIVLTFLHLLNTLLLHIPIAGNRDRNYLGIIEFFLLILPCFVYFTELLTKPSYLSLFQRPSFWITIGIFFYISISIPYYFLENYFWDSKYQYRREFAAIFFALPYGLTFLFLSKAFTLKTELTT